QRRLLAARGAADQIGPRLDADAAGEVRAAAADGGLPGAEHLDHVELVLHPSLVEELLERVPPAEEALPRDARGELPREPERGAGEILVVRVRDLERGFERVLDLTVEPALDR